MPMSPVRPVFDGRPDAQQVFSGEDDERHELDRVEQEQVAVVELRHRFERDGHEIDDDQEDQQPVDDDGGAVADRALLEHLVGALAKCPDPVACHAVVTLLESQRY
jgi:hypothetical protein